MKDRIRLVWVDDDHHQVLSREQQEIQLIEYLRAKEDNREPEDIRHYPADYVVVAEIAFSHRLSEL
jgi:hypothetical protein